MKVLAYPNRSGSAYWRLHDPFKYLQRLGVDAQVSDEGITEQAAQWADIFVLQSITDKKGIALLHAYQSEAGKKIVVDADDLLTDLPDDNPHKIEHQLSDATETIKITMAIADMVTCTTKHLAKELSQYNKNVVVLPNYMDFERWDLPKQPNTSGRIRIGWAGSATHLNDLKMVVNPLKRIMDEHKNVQLVFVGDPRMKEYFAGYPVETVLGVPFEEWPVKLNNLRLDIGIAPLLDNKFNKSKSNIKWLEYAVANIPGVYSPTVYQHKGFEPKYGLVAYDEDGWYGAIKNLIKFPELRTDIKENSYRLIKQTFNLRIEAHLWKEAYESLDANSR